MPSDDLAMAPADRLASALRALHARAGAPSTRNLAQRIGTVSHTTVAEALAGKRLSSWSTISEMVRALGGDQDEFERLWLAASEAAHQPAERPGDDFVPRYLRQVAAFTSSLEPAVPNRRVLVPFAELYVRQRVADWRTAGETDIWTFDDELERAVLLGDPGSGKSTFCRAIMLRHATETNRPVPFLITLRHFARTMPPAWSIVRYIEQTLETVFQTPVPEGAVARLLSAGQALVMFDGLDELMGAAARDVASIIELFSQQFPLARVLVTSRVAGYAHARLDPKSFQTYRLLQFTEEQVASYIRRWFAAMPALDWSEEQRELYVDRFLRLSSQTPELQVNPLLLGFSAQLYALSSSVPSDLATLVGRSVDLLLSEWDLSRGIEVSQALSLPLEPALQALALHMLDMVSPTLAEDDVLELLAESLEQWVSTKAEAESVARSILSYARERAWILTEVGIDRTGKSLYQFSHRTFLEYLAAKGLIAGDNPVQHLAQRLSDPNWHVAAEFVMELLDRSRPSGDQALAATLADEVAKLPPELRRSAVKFLTAHSDRRAAVQGRQRHDEALAAHQQAVAIYRQIADRHSEAMALDNLGRALHAVGRRDEAIDAWQEAVAIFRETGDDQSEGAALAEIDAAKAGTEP